MTLTRQMRPSGQKRMLDGGVCFADLPETPRSRRGTARQHRFDPITLPGIVLACERNELFDELLHERGCIATRIP